VPENNLTVYYARCFLNETTIHSAIIMATSEKFAKEMARRRCKKHTGKDVKDVILYPLENKPQAVFVHFDIPELMHVDPEWTPELQKQ
jgi:hypothetical protein